MAFSLNDLYLTSGIANLVSDFPESVHKYDSSSFYNWEEDNLPLYDLEERTDFLWSKLGYQGSTIPGMILTVSDSGINNTNVFSSISDAISTLPNVIAYPIIIEVATSGNLGELNLKNIITIGNGGLEIINRGFAKGLGTSSVTPSTTVTTLDGDNFISEFTSLDLSNSISENKTLLGVSLSSPNFWQQETRVFVLPTEYMENNEKTNTISVMVSAATNFITTTANRFRLTNYTDGVTVSDISLTHGIDGSVIKRPNITSGRATAVVYANSLNKLTAINCNGNIFVRGFCVDAGSAVSIVGQANSVGIDIKQSDFVLENIAVMRAADVGAQISNSNIILNRGFISYRNYRYNSTTKNTENLSFGLKAINSEITFSSTADSSKAIPIDSPFVFAYNAVGIEVVNSHLNLGIGRRGLTLDGTTVVTPTDNLYTLYLQCFKNNQAGILLRNSKIDNNHRISCWENGVGIESNFSELSISELCLDRNTIGLKASNSHIKYNKLFRLFTFPTSHQSQILFLENGQHINMFGGTLFSNLGPNTPSSCGNFHIKKNFTAKVQEDKKYTVPGVELNGVNAEFIKLRFETYDVSPDSTGLYDLGTNDSDIGSVKGSAIRAINSNIKFRGCGNGQTLLIGPSFWKNQRKNCGVYAGQGTTVEFCGPTTIVQFGLDVLAEDNSTIKFNPHNTDGIPDVSYFDLSTTSDHHTKVQLHSTRACLVVNRNSTLVANNLGDYHAFWANPAVYSSLVHDGSNIADFNPTDGLSLSAITSGGFLQFYPNPPTKYGVGAGLVNLKTYQVSALTSLFTTDSFEEMVNFSSVAASTNHVKYSYGGTCVKAFKNSVVDIKNVHFPAGWVNASDAIYNLSAGSNCGRLYIWNIGSDSHLNVSYASVSGNFPSLVNYHGPSSVWGNVSGAPLTTPDTSTLSILDSFGLSSNSGGTIHGASSFENKGPFRLYFSPAGPSKWLGYVNGVEVLEGVPYQILSQGYNPSGNVAAATPSSASSIYRELETSSFYYASSVLDSGYKHRIWLDDSGMNLFANAKNATLGTSGRPKLITYYKSSVRPQGEGYDSDKGASQGEGFFSANVFDLDREL